MDQTYPSTRFGELHVAPEGVLDFPTGLIGLASRRFALVATEEDAAFLWLHALDDPALAVPVCSPWAFFEDFEVVLADGDLERLGVDDLDEASTWVTVRVGQSPAEATANLKAPILIAGSRGLQVINQADAAPVRMPLFAFEEPAPLRADPRPALRA